LLLLDTNIFLEVLLGQERAADCAVYLQDESTKRYLSEFSLHSIGVVLFKLKKHKTFEMFLEEVLPHVGVLRLDAANYAQLAQVSQEIGLDFDDAMQYVVAKTYGLSLATLDRDFKKLEALPEPLVPVILL
jgi:uncharacterized protein